MASETEGMADESDGLIPLAFIEKGNADWSWQDGEWLAEIDTGSGFLISEEIYSNFEFIVEFKPDSTINSGVFLRCTNQEISAEDCYEFNIWDLNPNPEYRTGGVVFRTSASEDVETIGKWNTYRLVVQGDLLQAWINEVQVISLRDDSHSSGYIGLQAMGNGSIRFRNLQLSAAHPGE